MDHGQGCVADMLVFAVLTSVACSLLLASVPRAEIPDAYGASVARATLQSLQHATIDEFGGVTYSPTLMPERTLRHKTFTQLLLEDALLNSGIEISGKTLSAGLNSGMDERVKGLMRGVLERVLGGRFDFKFVARVVPIEPLPWIGVAFETSIESSPRGARLGWSETAVYDLPLGLNDGARVTLELTLTLWPR